MKKITIAFIFVILSFKSFSAYDAVIHRDAETIFINSDNSYTVVKTFHVTVNNRKGQHLANFIQPYNTYTEKMRVTGQVYNSMGKVIAKFPHKMIKDSKINTSSFIDDTRAYYYFPVVHTFPYTIKWSCSYTTNSLFFLSDWAPQYSENTLVESASLTINDKTKSSVKYKEMYGLEAASVQKNDAVTIYKWSLSNYEYPKWEENQTYTFPYLKLHSTKFTFAEKECNASSWNNIAKWVSQLNEGKAELPELFKTKVHELVKDCKTNEEKIKVLYAYLQENTRYVAISIKEEGMVPHSTKDVCEKNYGDCKDLSLFMTAMLREIGIESYYTLVNSGEQKEQEKLDTNFHSIEFNHVIVCIPQEKDTVWLECTSDFTPFNYLGDFTEDRYALLIKENGGELVRTPSSNIKRDKVKIHTRLDSICNNKIELEVLVEATGSQAHYLYGLSRIQQSKQESKLKGFIGFENSTIHSFSIDTIVNNNVPEVTLQVLLSLPSQSFKAQEMYMLPYCTVFNWERIKEIESRKTPFEFVSPISVESTFEIANADKYKFSFLPKEVDVNSEFGSYKTEINSLENTLQIHYTYIRKKGMFPKDSYNEYVSFKNSFVKHIDKKIIFSLINDIE